MEARDGRFKPNTNPGERPAGRKTFSQNASPDSVALSTDKPQSQQREVGAAEEILDTFDFRTIEDIIAEEIQRSGGERKDINFLGRDKVAVKNMWLSQGTYGPSSNRIKINARKLSAFVVDSLHKPGGPSWKGNSFKYQKNDEKLLDLPRNTIETLYLLDTLIHEEWHACSNVVIEPSNNLIGYENQSLQPRWWSKKFHRWQVTRRPFDEAVTERLAQESLLEYVRRVPPTGVSSPAAEEFVRALQYRKSPSSYTRERFFLGCALEAISHEQGIPKEQVWQAIKRGYIRGVSVEESFDGEDSPLMKLVVEGINASGARQIAKAAFAILKKLPEDRRAKLEELYLTFPPSAPLAKTS
jgi:hypothetical protein